MDSKSCHPSSSQDRPTAVRQISRGDPCPHGPPQMQALPLQAPTSESVPQLAVSMAFPNYLRPLHPSPLSSNAAFNYLSAEFNDTRLATWPGSTEPEHMAGISTFQRDSIDTCHGNSPNIGVSLSNMQQASLNLAPFLAEKTTYQPKIHLPSPNNQLSLGLPADHRRYVRPMSATDFSYPRSRSIVPRGSASVNELPSLSILHGQPANVSDVPSISDVPVPGWGAITEAATRLNPRDGTPIDSERAQAPSSKFDVPSITYRAASQSQPLEHVHAVAALTNLSKYQKRISPDGNVLPVGRVMQEQQPYFGRIQSPALTTSEPNAPQVITHVPSGSNNVLSHERSLKRSSENLNEAFGLINMNERAPICSRASNSHQFLARSNPSTPDLFHPGSWSQRSNDVRVGTHRQPVYSRDSNNTPGFQCETVGHLHKTVVRTSVRMQKNMAHIETGLLGTSIFTNFLYQTKVKIQQHEGLAGHMWDGPGSQKVKLQSRYPRGAEDIEGILDEATVLDENVYKILQANLISRLDEVRNSAIMVEDMLERRLHRQFQFRPVPVEEVDRRMEYIKYKFLKARHVVVEKYKMFVRVLKWVSLSPQRVRRGSHTREQNYELRQWLFKNFRNPYPNPEQKSELMRVCSMSDTQIANWFINGRVRIWKPCINSVNISQAACETLIALEKKRMSREAFSSNETPSNQVDI